MADYKVTDTELTSIANAIRAKTGKEAQIEFPTEFVSEIGSISGGEEFYSNIVISSSWVIRGRTAYNRSGTNEISPFGESDFVRINTKNSHRIGIAVKNTSLASHAIIVNNDSSHYAEAPGIELQQNGHIGFGVPGGGTNWTRWINLQSYSANEWIYCEYKYDKQLGEVTVKITKDFVNWTTQTVSITPYGNSSILVRFSGWSGHAGGNLTIDFANTFIESNGTIVWGKYTGAFPE